MKILVLVLSLNDGGTYTKFYDTQKKTWDSVVQPGVETYYYFGNHDCEEIKDQNIFVNVNESLMNCGYKLLKTFDLIKDLEFDFLFRTNSSSYIDKKKLYEFLSDKPKKNFYSGVIGDLYNIKYASGSGLSLSRDLFNLIMDNKKDWDHTLVDDMSIGKILSKFGIYPTECDRYNVDSQNNIPTDFFHYRLKTSEREFDIQNMMRIHDLKLGVTS
jgi:hypothetical protein